MKSNGELYKEIAAISDKDELDRKLHNWLLNYKRKLKAPPIQPIRDKYKNECTAILNDLNRLLSTKYTATDEYVRMISYWLNQGKTVQDFKTVHMSRFNYWYLNDKMRQYLTPMTLYRKGNFDKYLQTAYADQAKIKKQNTSPASQQEIVASKGEISRERHEEIMKKLNTVRERQKAKKQTKIEQQQRALSHKERVLKQIEWLKTHKSIDNMPEELK